MEQMPPQRTPTEIGVELSGQLEKLIVQITNDVAFLKAELSKEHKETVKLLFNLDDIDTEAIVRELIIMTYVGQRLAVQLIHKKGSKRDVTRRMEISNALDSCTLKYLDNSVEFSDLLDKRGGFYFQLLQSHSDVIDKGDWKPFFDGLEFHFEQFCLGRDVGEKAPIIIGKLGSKLPLDYLASKYWGEGFTKTVKLLKEESC